MKTILEKDRQILRGIAAKQMQLAHMPCNEERINLWQEHNNFRGRRPMIHLELWTFEQEVIAPLLACEGEYARSIEKQLYTHFLNQELFDDDRVTPDYFPVEWQVDFVPFGLKENITHATSGIGHHFNEIIQDLEDDFDKLGKSVWSVDRDATNQYAYLLSELFGDILPVKLVMNCLYSVPTQKIVHLMSMETMFVSMYDYPELFHEMMRRFADDTIEYFRWLEQEKLILPTVHNESLGQGTWCYTEELPGEDVLRNRALTTRDVWGFMDSQETVGISPQMFEEFIFPYYKKIADQFGLLSYGCCEPVNPIWESCLSKLENLRKISVSPWCDEEFMGERLRGRKIIFHRKPSPSFLGLGSILDEGEFRKHIRKSLTAAKGCKMEITQRDVYSINHDIAKARRYISIIREEIENNWV